MSQFTQALVVSALRRAAIESLVVCLAFGACDSGARRSGEGSSARGVGGGALAVAATQDTAGVFSGTLGPVRRLTRRLASPALLRAVGAVQHSGFDRVVFEFSGDSLPGYEIQYVTGPIRSCGSGDIVALAGPGRLLVRLEQAQAHDTLGRVTLERRAFAPGLPQVRELKQVCDFEGQVEWAVSLTATHRYRVLEAAEPPRVIVDVRHHD